jgi:hypothetical protein
MIRDFVKELAKRGHAITIEEWNNTALNSFERYYLFEYLNNATLLAICKVYNQHTTPTRNPSTYDEAVVNLLFPELIRRLEPLSTTPADTKERIRRTSY